MAASEVVTHYKATWDYGGCIAYNTNFRNSRKQGSTPYGITRKKQAKQSGVPRLQFLFLLLLAPISPAGTPPLNYSVCPEHSTQYPSMARAFSNHQVHCPLSSWVGRAYISWVSISWEENGMR